MIDTLRVGYVYVNASGDRILITDGPYSVLAFPTLYQGSWLDKRTKDVPFYNEEGKLYFWHPKKWQYILCIYKRSHLKLHTGKKWNPEEC